MLLDKQYTECINIIKRREGFSARAYHDTNNVLTIGYGTNLECGISEKSALALLDSVLEECRQELDKQTEKNNIPSNLSDGWNMALLLLSYNIGVAGVLKFKKMIQALKDGDFAKAREEMRNSKWLEQVGNDRVNEVIELTRD